MQLKGKVLHLSLKMKDLPKAERPYEKLELFGEKNLTNAELLAIIIKTGTREETSVQVAQHILNLNNSKDDTLNFLGDLSLQDFMKIKGIGKVKAIQLKAICELAVRMVKPSDYRKMKISTQSEIANICVRDFFHEKKEIARVYFLNVKNIVLQVLDIAIGGTNFVNVSIKEILAKSIELRANKIILVHNHPSGDSTPSKQDVEFTGNLLNAGKIVEIDLLDHIVVAKNEYTSIFTNIKHKIEGII